MAATTGPEETLAWEARQRPRAAIAAAVASIAILAAALSSGLLFGDAPRSWFGESLGRTLEPGPLAREPSLQIPFYEYYADRTNLVFLGSAVRALGWLATGWALYVLAGATLSRRPELRAPVVYLPLFAGVLSALATLMVDVASKLAVDDFLAGPRTVAAAQDVTASGVLVLGQFLGLAGSFAASLSFVLIALNAMRAGLLTRFMGVLGIIVGVLLIFPIGAPIPIVQCYWLAALAVLLVGRWPNGTPPAWESGKAEPWPSTAGGSGARARPSVAAKAPREPAASATRGNGAGKRKRKRRA